MRNYWIGDYCFYIRLTRPNPFKYGQKIWEAYLVEGNRHKLIAQSEISLSDVRKKVKEFAASNHIPNHINMKELDLYQFLKKNEVEMRWDDDVLSAWVSHWHLAEFAELIGSSLHEGGRDARIMSDGSVWVDLVPICDYYGIDPERIFPNQNR